MHSDKCGYCGKWVCHKPILGTMHFCLPDEECAKIDRARAAMRQQSQFIANQQRLGKPFEDVLYRNLWNLYARDK